MRVVTQRSARVQHVHVGERVVEHDHVGWGRGLVAERQRLGGGEGATHRVTAPLSHLGKLLRWGGMMARDQQLGRAVCGHLGIIGRLAGVRGLGVT